MINWRKDSAHADLSERDRRINGVRYVFEAFGKTPTDSQATIYLLETRRIPFWFFRKAIQSVLGSHLWGNVPTIGEIQQAAQEIAGMHREQYDAGHYLSPCSVWPADGFRHGIAVRSFEAIGRNEGPIQLTAGPVAQQIAPTAGTPEGFAPLSAVLDGEVEF